MKKAHPRTAQLKLVGFLPLVFLGSMFLWVKSPQKVEHDQSAEKSKNLDSVELEFFANRYLSKEFVKRVEFKIESNVEKVIYGNAQVGYFETPDWDQEDSKLAVDLVPPSYKTSIEFYVRSEGGLRLLAKKSFRVPQTELNRKFQLDRVGQINVPFIALTGILYPRSGFRKGRGVYNLIVNRLGEVVWVHIPSARNRVLDKYATIKPIAAGKYAILYSEEDSFFEIVDYRGHVELNYDGWNRTPQVIIHHDFHLDYERKKLITFSNEKSFLRNIDHQNFGWNSFIDFLLPPLSYVSNTLVEIDLQTQKAKKVWDPWDHFYPLRPELFAFEVAGTRTQLSTFPENVFVDKDERAQIDLLHANSIQKTEAGYLISMRNMHRAVMLSHDFKKVLYTVGPDSFDSFRPLGELHTFYRQHHISQLPNGNLLLMDNHTSPPAPGKIGSRVLEVRLDRNSGFYHVVWNYQPHYSLETLTRGSAYPLRSNNRLVFYPDTIGGNDFIVEVGYPSGKPTGYMKLSFDRVKRIISDRQRREFQIRNIYPSEYVAQGGGNRAYPLYGIGKENYIGEHPQRSVREEISFRTDSIPYFTR